MSFRNPSLPFLVACVTVIQSAGAQDFKIVRSSFTNGGGTDQSEGAYQASGTIGVSHAKEMTGGQFRISGSLWTKTRTPECNEDIPGYGECYDEELAGPDTIKHWSGDEGLSGGREWGMCLNWYENAIPQDGDNACIPEDNCQDFIIYRETDTVLNSMACNQGFVIDGTAGSTRLELDQDSFVLDDMQITGNSTVWTNGHLQVGGQLDWNGGRVDGHGITEVYGGLSITNGSVELGRGDFKLTGGQGFSNGPLVNMFYGATFEIGPQATYEYQGNGSSFYGGNSLLDVRGAFTRTAGIDTANIWSPVNNEGLIRNQTGQFYFYLGGTHSGSVISDPGTTLGFQGTHIFAPGSSLIAETVDLNSGSGSVVHGTVNISERIDGKGAIWSFADDATILDYGNHLYVERGSVEFNAPVDQAIDFETVTITTPGESSGTVRFDTGQPVNVVTFTMITGSLYGSSPINADEFNWTNGLIWHGGPITVNGDLTFNSTNQTRTIFRTVNILNEATLYSGFSMSGSNARINIEEGATVTIQDETGGIGGGVFANNGGTVIRNSGDGDFSISSAIINDGLFHNQTGTFSFATHPLNGASTYTGDIISDPGATLKFSGSNHDLQSSSSITAETLQIGAFDSECHGTVNVSDGIVADGCSWTFSPDANIINYGDQLSLNNGTLKIEAPTDRELNFASVNVTNSTLHFNTGHPVNVNNFTLDGHWLMGNSRLNILESFSWTNGGFWWGGYITNEGTFTVNPTTSQRDMMRRFDNYGTMILNGGFGLSGTTPINNMPDGVIELRNGGFGLGGVINNDGTIVKSAGTGASSMPDTINRGTFDIQSGSVEFHTSYNEYRQTAGETILNDTSLVFFLQSSPFYLEGGALKGTGDVEGHVDNSGGMVSPGLSFGELNVSGNYTQGENGMLDIEIGGGLPEEYDLLTVGGTAELAGELR
ncbi:MAG: hypothetical protein ACYTHJ_19825, partial [Planctomycetota bacterium]